MLWPHDFVRLTFELSHPRARKKAQEWDTESCREARGTLESETKTAPFAITSGIYV